MSRTSQEDLRAPIVNHQYLYLWGVFRADYPTWIFLSRSIQCCFFFWFYWDIINTLHCISLRYTTWFGICTYYEMITTIILLNHHLTYFSFFFSWCKLLRSLLVTFTYAIECCSPVTMLCLTTLELTHLITASFYLLPFSLISPICPPSSLATTNLFSIFSAV